LEQIRIAGERAAKLTTQLLAFSRKQMLRIEIISINDVILDLEKMLQRMIGEDVNLNIIYDQQLNPVKADRGQIEQIIINIVVNAKDAMPQGGNLTIETQKVKITDEYITTHPQISPGDYTMIAITDSGIGMDKKTQDRIFEPFFTTKEKGKGTGLGLSPVYGIVKQSGGYIWVYSEPGQGTTFKIYLPSVFEKIEEKENNIRIPVSYEGTETILLVEDEDAVRDLAHKVLQENGYQVLDAKNGGEALLIYEEYSKPIDLIITDVVMPMMSGKKLIKRLEKLKSVAKVIYVSGYTDDVIVHHGILEEGINFVQKPFSPISLLKEVRRVLDQN